MGYRVALGDGKYCYTVNCKKHSQPRDSGLKSSSNASLQEVVSSVIDRNDPEWGAYYDATEKKHLADPSKPGSKFINPALKTLEDVLALTYIQRKGLEGDDREFFISQGADPSAFKDGFRYLKVDTLGKLGIVSSAGLKDSTVVSVERTKPGAPCNFVLLVDEQPTVNYGVVILEGEGDSSRLITMFPGAPTYVSLSQSNKERVDAWEGTTLTVAELRERMERDVTLNTRLLNK